MVKVKVDDPIATVWRERFLVKAKELADLQIRFGDLEQSNRALLDRVDTLTKMLEMEGINGTNA